ncbi:MAG TPA: AmmeMemoRadiSam system protein A [Burkholderiaceae bacterium]
MSAPDFDDTLGRALIACARDEIARELQLASWLEVPDHPALASLGATFVTLTQSGRLRGCIGTLSAHRTLVADVRANAVAAALRDPRFAPLSRPEFARTLIGVSLLGATKPMPVQSEEDALAQLEPFDDGIVLVWRNRRATFLPQVWESLPQPGDFLRELKRKAGLPADFWSHEIALSRYRVAKWQEADADALRGGAAA